jgi:hypothetical protein
MDGEQLKKMFGDEYPAAVIDNGTRMPLRLETQFTRYYNSQERKQGTNVSRFMDGSASMTATDLEREWLAWTAWQRLDFCQSCCWLYKRPILRTCFVLS